MAGRILAKNAIFNISKSFPQTQSLFLRSFSSSIHKFSKSTFTSTTSVKEKLAEAGERKTKTEMPKKAKQKTKHKAAAEVKDRTKGNAQNVKEKSSCKNKAEETKEKRKYTAAGISVAADKAKEGAFKASKSSAQNVKEKSKDMAGKSDQETKEKQMQWKKPPEGWHVLSTDGSAREDIGGIGGLIRDENGSVVRAFAAGIPTAPIPVIEIKAIVEGVKMAITNISVTKIDY